MGNLKHISSIVKEILEEDPKARNSDSYLYLAVCRRINPDVENMSFFRVMVFMNALGLPKMESVRRTRQKVQHDNPELSGNDEVQAHRMVNEQKYKDYARGF